MFLIVPKVISNSLQIPLLPPNLLENEIQLSKFENLIGFFQEFMKQVASHLPNRQEIWELYKVEGF